MPVISVCLCAHAHETDNRSLIFFITFIYFFIPCVFVCPCIHTCIHLPWHVDGGKNPTCRPWFRFWWSRLWALKATLFTHWPISGASNNNFPYLPHSLPFSLPFVFWFWKHSFRVVRSFTAGPSLLTNGAVIIICLPLNLFPAPNASIWGFVKSLLGVHLVWPEVLLC